MNRPEHAQSLGDHIEQSIGTMPADSISLAAILDHFGPQSLLLLTVVLTLVFLIPVSVPGVSTVFGAAILLVGISRLLHRPLWLPKSLRDRPLPADKLRAALLRGMVWVRKLERISKPRRLTALVDSRLAERGNDLALILGALLLMAPFGFIPFSNTLPGIALLCLAIGLMQRDGLAILLGHLANLATILYFGVLIAGGGLAIRELFQRFGPGA